MKTLLERSTLQVLDTEELRELSRAYLNVSRLPKGHTRDKETLISNILAAQVDIDWDIVRAADDQSGSKVDLVFAKWNYQGKFRLQSPEESPDVSSTTTPPKSELELTGSPLSTPPKTPAPLPDPEDVQSATSDKNGGDPVDAERRLEDLNTTASKTLSDQQDVQSATREKNGGDSVKDQREVADLDHTLKSPTQSSIGLPAQEDSEEQSGGCMNVDQPEQEPAQNPADVQETQQDRGSTAKTPRQSLIGWSLSTVDVVAILPPSPVLPAKKDAEMQSESEKFMDVDQPTKSDNERLTDLEGNKDLESEMSDNGNYLSTHRLKRKLDPNTIAEAPRELEPKRRAASYALDILGDFDMYSSSRGAYNDSESDDEDYIPSPHSSHHGSQLDHPDSLHDEMDVHSESTATYSDGKVFKSDNNLKTNNETPSDKVTGQEAATIQEESLTNSPTLDAINSLDPQLASGRPTNPPTDSTVPSAVVHQSAPVDLPDQVKPPISAGTNEPLMAGESSSPAHVGLAAGIVGQTGLEQVHQPAVPNPPPGISNHDPRHMAPEPKPPVQLSTNPVLDTAITGQTGQTQGHVESSSNNQTQGLPHPPASNSTLTEIIVDVRDDRDTYLRIQKLNLPVNSFVSSALVTLQDLLSALIPDAAFLALEPVPILSVSYGQGVHMREMFLHIGYLYRRDDTVYLQLDPTTMHSTSSVPLMFHMEEQKWSTVLSFKTVDNPDIVSVHKDTSVSLGPNMTPLLTQHVDAPPPSDTVNGRKPSGRTKSAFAKTNQKTADMNTAMNTYLLTRYGKDPEVVAMRAHAKTPKKPAHFTQLVEWAKYISGLYHLKYIADDKIDTVPLPDILKHAKGPRWPNMEFLCDHAHQWMTDGDAVAKYLIQEDKCAPLLAKLANGTDKESVLGMGNLRLKLKRVVDEED